MPKHSQAYTKFERTISRSVVLLNTYHTLLRQKINNERMRVPKDLIRASVVLSVAALDAYITDVFSEKLVPYIKKFKPDDELIKILQDSGLDTKEALNLIKMERPYRRIRNLVERYYATFTTQRFEVIDKLFLAYRLKKFLKGLRINQNGKHLNAQSKSWCNGVIKSLMTVIIIRTITLLTLMQNKLRKE